MTFLESTQWRYATKQYDSSKLLKESDIKDLAKILRLCPSSINSQPWKFTFVEDPKLKAQLAAQSFYNEERINQAPLLIVFSVADNLEQFEKSNIDTLHEGVKGYYYDHKEAIGEEQVKVWMAKQVYIALGFCMAACAQMQLDSTPMEGIVAQAYREILDMKDYAPLFSVAVGYRDAEDFNQPSKNPKSRLALDEVVNHIK